MKNIKIITILAVLLLANVLYGERQAPVFPRGTAQLQVIDRLDETSKIAYSIMSDQDINLVRYLFIELDHTDRMVNKPQARKAARLQVRILEVFFRNWTTAIFQGLTAIPPSHDREANLRLKWCVIDDVNFGIRYCVNANYLDTTNEAVRRTVPNWPRVISRVDL
jgi:hypothetical protein